MLNWPGKWIIDAECKDIVFCGPKSRSRLVRASAAWQPKQMLLHTFSWGYLTNIHISILPAFNYKWGFSEDLKGVAPKHFPRTPMLLVVRMPQSHFRLGPFLERQLLLLWCCCGEFSYQSLALPLFWSRRRPCNSLIANASLLFSPCFRRCYPGYQTLHSVLC